MAEEKQTTTIANQAALVTRDLAVDMCTSPWIVEFSKNSQRVAVTMFKAYWVKCTGDQ